jgi:hypothetical protein
MSRLSARLEKLESKTAPCGAVMVQAVLEREPDPTAWLLSPGGKAAEKSALLRHILKQVEGRSKGLPQERAIT